MQKEIDKYRVIEQIGAGTAGVVYRAEDPSIGRSVAIKVMKADYFGSPSVRNQAVERFSSEIRAIGRLVHTNIVSIFDSGITAEGLPYLVMQCVEGRGLDLIIRDSGGALSPERSLKILKQLGAAIDYAHTQNVVHRDIKPSNILVAPDDHVYIVDFSTAVFADDTLLPTGQVVGTPEFMAPEVVRGEKASASADLYSLGIIAFLLFTGKKPFREGNIAATFDAVLRQSAFSFAELSCPLGARLERVLRRALAKNPEDRFTTASEFLSECEKSLGKLATNSFSQVAEEASPSATGVFKAQYARRDNMGRLASLRTLLISMALLIILGAGVATTILFVLDEDNRLNQLLRIPFGMQHSESDLYTLSSERLIKILEADLPYKVQHAAINEAIRRNTSELAITISTLISDPNPDVRRQVVKAIVLMSSLPANTRDFLLFKSLGDPDPFIRVFAATEVAKYQAKKAKTEITKQREHEQDAMVARMLDFILAKI